MGLCCGAFVGKLGEFVDDQEKQAAGADGDERGG